MIKNVLSYSSYFLLCWISLILIITNVSFLIGFDLRVINVIISFLLTVLLLNAAVKNLRMMLFSLSLAFIICLISYVAAISFFDTSWDGQGYHQETIYLLKNGWNPVHENSKAFRTWINHYQKGNEIIQANIYLLTAKIESGKIINLLFVYIAFVSVFSFLSTVSIKHIYKWLIMFVVVFNPVVFTQVFTNYIDANWYLTLVISLSSLLSYTSNRQIIGLISFILSSVIFCSLKLTSIPVFIILAVFVLAYQLFFQTKKIIIPFLVIFMLSGICNVHPFLTNVQNGYHILHPFAGDKKSDVLNQNIPKVLLNHNRIERVLISLFSKPNNDKDITLENTLKIPFSVDKRHLFLIYDTRLGGFGFLFSGLLVITTVLMIYLLWAKNTGIDKKKFLWILFALFCSILINPAAWWTRLSPQIWLFPIVVIIFGLFAKNRVPAWLSKISLLVFLINIAVPSYLSYTELKANQKTMETFISAVGEKTIILDISNPRGFQQYFLKFKERNIKYRVEQLDGEILIAPFTPDVYYKIR